MGLRAKLFIPMLMLMLIVASLIHFYWLPNYLEFARKNHVANENAYIELLSTALTPSILTNDIAQAYLTLNRVMSKREYWLAVKLYNVDGKRLYPLSEKALPRKRLLDKFNHTITYEQGDIGRMEVWIDIDTLTAKNVSQIESLERLLLMLILAMSFAATIQQDRWIRAPLAELIGFAKGLSQGRYDVALTHQSGDEMGELVDSFNSMRDQIQAREEELQKAYTELSDANDQLEQLSNTDAVTNISNRRYFDEMLAHEISRSSRLHTPVALIICDIDFFKKYNDSYGHHQGDICLREVAKAITHVFERSTDVVARIGGEEFAVILPDANKEDAIKLAHAMREIVEALKLPHQASEVADYVTISVGVTIVVPDKDTVMSMLIQNADKALYLAKHEGRNTVRVI